MAETSVNKLPYPADLDQPDGPTQIKALAEALDVLKWGSRNLKPTIGQIRSTSAPGALSTAYSDITGATLSITPAVASVIAIVGTFELSVHATNSATTAKAVGAVNLDGTVQTGVAELSELAPATNVVMSATVVQTWLLSLTAAAHTIKLQAKKESGTEAGCNGAGFLYVVFAS